MKKFLSMFIALAMVLSLFAGVGVHTAKAATTATVTVGTATVVVGGTQTIDVTATIPATENIATMQFTLTYDGTKISIPSAEVTAGGLSSTFVANNAGSGAATTLTVGGLAPNLTTGVVGPTVVLAHVTVHGLAAGTTSIALAVTTLADASVASFTTTAVNGSATVTAVPPFPVSMPAPPSSPTVTITGLNTADTYTKLPTYITGTTITGMVVQSGTPTLHFLRIAQSTNGTTWADVSPAIRYPANGAGYLYAPFTFSLPLAANMAEGVYRVDVLSDVGVIENFYYFYVAHTSSNIMTSTALKAGATNVVFSGKQEYNAGTVVAVLKMALDLKSGVVVGRTVVNPDGTWSILVTNAIDYGTYNVYASDGRGEFTDGLAEALGAATVGASVSTYDLTNKFGLYAYKSFTVAPGTLTLTKVVEPTLAYADGSVQRWYIYVTDSDGNAVTTGVQGAWDSGVAVTGLTFNTVGNGFYFFQGTPSTIGIANLRVFAPVGAATLGLEIKPVDGYMPRISRIDNLDTAMAIGSTTTLDVYPSFVVNTTGLNNPHRWLKDSAVEVTGPVTVDDSTPGVYKLSFQTGGQAVVTMKALLWNKDTAVADNALTATHYMPTTDFSINPAITSDVVAFTPDSANVGDTQDITVTMKTPSGTTERNNGYVRITGSVADMFTAPASKIYTVDGSLTDTVGSVLVLDARTTSVNVNIVGGKYVFSGITFNHAGTVTIETFDGTMVQTGSFVEAITVNPKVHALTSDVAKFVAGQVYPTVKISGGIAGLAMTAKMGTTVVSPVAVDGTTYVFNFPAGIADVAKVTFKAAYGTDDVYTVDVPVVKPTITLAAPHDDKLITANRAEKVVFALADPITGAALPFTGQTFAIQYTTWDVTGNNDLAVSSLSGHVADVVGSTATAGYGNPAVDVALAKLTLKATINGTVVSFADQLLVSDAIITVTPKDLVLYYNQSNMFSVNALDAHKAPIEGANVWGENDYLQTIPTLVFGGITGADGTVAFQYVPNYIGEIAIDTELGVDPYVVQIVPAPADTTAPVIKVAAGLDGSTVATDVLNLTGSVNEKVSALYVGFNKVDVLPDGSFMTTVKLAAGLNTIDMTAYDLAGNKGTLSIKVTFTAPAAATKTVIVLTVGTDVVMVDGKATSIDAAPEIVNSRTFVPIRFISETFGADVEWLAETQGITITLGNSTIGLQIGNATAVIDGNIVSLPAAPYIKNGRTMVPLRVISDAFGGDVVWDAALRTITITYIQP